MIDPIRDYIFSKGKEYRVPSALPDDIVQGEVGHCYENALQNSYSGKYRYVEGYAENPGVNTCWILHAWVTDGVHVFDGTWRAVRGVEQFPVHTRYIGIEIPLEDVLAFMLKTHYKALFANAWRDLEVARKALPDLPDARASDIVVKID